MSVNIVCQNHTADRVIPRFARYLAAAWGWPLTAAPQMDAAAVYLTGYFEGLRGISSQTAALGAYFTHLETDPKSKGKADLWWSMAERVDLRIVTAAQYGKLLEPYGPTVQILPPVERDRFTLPTAAPHRPRPVVGFSGYTYGNGRKGEQLARLLVQSKVGRSVAWMASGRGWPVKTEMYSWAAMPSFYQGLDVLVVTSRVEGVPMPALEALACGVSIVIPHGVGLLDELGDVRGIYRYHVDDVAGATAALAQAVGERPEVDRAALRAITEPFTIQNWADGHRRAFENVAGGVEPERSAATAVASQRGIVCVAFGEPARACAQRLIASVKKYLPQTPLALVAAAPLGGEDVFIAAPDGDVGARRAKLSLYDLVPAEWESVLYLDADTEVVSADVAYLFEALEQGWELVMCGDLRGRDSMAHYRRPDNGREFDYLKETLPTLNVLQMNGGVWAFRRCERTAEFMRTWRTEWERWGMRDQGALALALHRTAPKLLTLGAEWNTFDRYGTSVRMAAVRHYPGTARRWQGLLPGRLDSDAAWSKVNA